MEIIFITILTIIGACIGTLTGFGTSTIMIPFLLFFFPLPETLLLVGILHWFGDIWRILLFKKGFNWKLILAFGIPGIIASYLGASITITADKTILSQVLGIFLVLYVILLFVKSNFKLPQSIPIAAIGGASSGFLAGIFGIGGTIRGMFLSAFNLPKTVYISTVGVIAFFIDITRITTYLTGGIQLNKTLWLGFILFIPATFLGAKIAKKFIDKIPQQYFRYVIGVFLFIMGIKLIIYPLQ